MEAMQFSHHIRAKNKATHKSIMGAYARRNSHFGVHKITLPQPTQISHKGMEERR